MSEWPTRLVHDDPDFARLVDASRRHEPSSKGLDETLSLVTRAAGRGTRSSIRWSATHFVAGAALVGAAVFAVATMWRSSRPPSVVAVSPAGTMPSVMPSVNAPVPTLPVEALAEVPTTGTSSRAAAPNASGERSASRRDESAAAPREARGARDVSPPASPSAGRASFREELALVSAARSALEANDYASGLRAADRYDERFRSGVLRQEIEVIRITALFDSGERTRGESHARRFLAANGASPYASQVRSLLERP
ncbi:MAG: hypothetical protein K0S65_2315 [Labilithrix sp.]|nr:hypothetical protein [Labilithrix sp.]